ncbi:Protein of unknown function [Pyronema omphalodes CBS 100304]|uniref:Uncharacterized protein n=1 Tax=Pyronema omphalodes (strain CBS 100304) TaxID=1076935 RepID=U4LMI6_PYROM|nr:Protein of unknown function [Pyronema omphalodes CBS 100304]
MLTITSQKWSHRDHRGFFKREEGITSFGFPGKKKTQLNFIFDANQDFDFKFHIKASISAFRSTHSSSITNHEVLRHHSSRLLPSPCPRGTNPEANALAEPEAFPEVYPEAIAFPEPEAEAYPEADADYDLEKRHLLSPIEQHSDTRAMYQAPFTATSQQAVFLTGPAQAMSAIVPSRVITSGTRR